MPHPVSRRCRRPTLPALAAAASIGLAAAASPCLAQDQGGPPQPMPAPPVPPIAPPQDRPYVGPITLKVDATDTDRHIFSTHETIPVDGAGDHVLFFPRWVPGDHSPTGQIDKLGSLVIRSGGKALEWVRDPVDVYAFHVPVPAGATALDIDLQYLSPTDPKQGRIVMTPSMLSLEFNEMLLYPAGYFTRDIPVNASVTYPAGWRAFSANDVASTSGATVSYKTTPLNLLVDNPVIAGRYARQEDLAPGSAVPVHLDIVGDLPEDLAITPAQLAVHRKLVAQAVKLFASQHYAHYDFLLSLSDELGEIGEEHHLSSEDGTGRGYFTDWNNRAAERDLLSHEYSHSWNGKFRRPADLWQPNFNVPERDSLLWVYEGQTQYWGQVLASRSGLFSKQDILDSLALIAATYSNGIGRDWRDLEDTTNDPIIAERRPIAWRSWQRSEDYYDEGLLVWMDVDTKIRAMSHDTKSLDSFAATFFGIDNGSAVTQTYTLDDVVRALNAVQPFDWASFLHQRLYANGPGTPAPLNGLAQGGYRLAFDDKISPFQKSDDAIRESDDFAFSVGLVLGKTGTVRGSVWNSPAFKAGIVAGSQILAVNGMTYDADLFKQAIVAAKSDHQPIALLVKAANHIRTVQVAYDGGLRYPHLVRIDPSKPASLDAILAARP